MPSRLMSPAVRLSLSEIAAELDAEPRRPVLRAVTGKAHVDRNVRRRAYRSHTISNSRATRRELIVLQEVNAVLYPEGIERPKTRGDCVRVPRPFVSCKWHLYLDVTSKGALKLNFPDVQPWEIGETCALDLAERGPLKLEDVGSAMNLQRERVRQIEIYASALVRSRLGELWEDFGA